MEFIPVYFSDKLKILNKRARCAIVTLWSSPDYVLDKLRNAGVDLTPESSPIAVVGTLYGGGLRELLRNLLYNPQIETLFLFGRRRSASADELASFFRLGVEPYRGDPLYEMPSGEPVAAVRVKETTRTLDCLVTPETFASQPRLVDAGDPHNEAECASFAGLLAGLRAEPAGELPRVDVPLPQSRVEVLPSNRLAHAVCADEVLEAWEDLVFRLFRFGKPVRLPNGKLRKELLNVKVVVNNPGLPSAESLSPYWITREELLAYQKAILDPSCPDDVDYTYGHRLRTYFGMDTLETIGQRLRALPENRHSYVSLWDTRSDTLRSNNVPCLVTLFARLIDDRLTLTATFRTHNALDGWLVNFAGLLAIQGMLCDRSGLAPGQITVLSHSISINMNDAAKARIIADRRKRDIHLDPNGYFTITVDHEAQEIVMQHFGEGNIFIAEYRHANPETLQYDLTRDLAISDIGHAVYIGRELAKAQYCLLSGCEYVQNEPFNLGDKNHE